MDKRNFRRRAMHGNLFKKPTISKSSDDEEDMFVKASQNSSKKLSNTQRLRMIESQSRSQNQENPELNSDNDNTPKKKKQRSPTSSPKGWNNLSSSKKSPKTSSRNDGLFEDEPSPPITEKSQRSLNPTKKRITESPRTSVQKKQRKIINQVENDEENNYVDLETFFKKCGITLSESNDQQVYSIGNN